MCMHVSTGLCYLTHLAPDQLLPFHYKILCERKSNDPGIQLQKSIINAKQKFWLTSYFFQFVNTVFLHIQQVLSFEKN